MEERKLKRLRDWAAGPVIEVEPVIKIEVKNIANLNSRKSVRMSTPKSNSLYPSLKALQQQDPLNSWKRVRMSTPKSNSLYPSLKALQQQDQVLTSAMKVEPTILRDNISISRLGWNRDETSVRMRCRTDANLKAAAFLSKH